MKYSRDWLQHHIEQGIHVEYYFFWGHTQKKKMVVDKSCFSQWYPSAFEVDGITYFTAEHWMMAKKAELFNDSETMREILTFEKPVVAKALGREIKNFNPDSWANASYEIVVEGNKHKFYQNEALKNFLIQTGDMILVEASPVDAIWGIGLGQDAIEAKNPYTWKGSNLLGFALMEVRDLLK